MAEPISLASGLITLATFALQSSTTLFQTVQSFQNHPQRVRDLETELGALSGVLRTLTDTISTTTGVDLSDLELPLLQCGKACKDFQQELLRCSSRSGGNRTSFRDWAKLRYLGDNIDDFRQLLASYKTTITIALTDANLRKSSVTAENLQSYQGLIQTATDDLEARLEAIDEKLESVFARTATEEEAAELRRIKEERLSTQKCLLICAQLSEHIKEIQPELSQRQERSSDDSDALSETIMSRGLQECKASLTQTTARLEKHMLDLLDQLMTKTKPGMTHGEIADLTRLQDEWTTARQCINICSKAEDHLKENISIIDNHATGDDAVQFLVSTRDKTIHGKNRGHGFRIRQIGGHLSDESVQQLSQDISRISMPNSGREGIYAQEDSSFNSRNIAQKSTSRKQDAFKPGEDADSKVVKQEEVKQNSSQKRSGSGT